MTLEQGAENDPGILAQPKDDLLTQDFQREVPAAGARACIGEI